MTYNEQNLTTIAANDDDCCKSSMDYGLWTWCGWQVGNELKTERDVIMYRAYVAQRKFGVVLS